MIDYTIILSWILQIVRLLLTTVFNIWIWEDEIY